MYEGVFHHTTDKQISFQKSQVTNEMPSVIVEMRWIPLRRSKARDGPIRAVLDSSEGWVLFDPT
jgi:hypothetical protein